MLDLSVWMAECCDAREDRMQEYTVRLWGSFLAWSRAKGEQAEDMWSRRLFVNALISCGKARLGPRRNWLGRGQESTMMGLVLKLGVAVELVGREPHVRVAHVPAPPPMPPEPPVVSQFEL